MPHRNGITVPSNAWPMPSPISAPPIVPTTPWTDEAPSALDTEGPAPPADDAATSAEPVDISGTTLTVSNWDAYMPKSVVKDFEAAWTKVMELDRYDLR